MVTTFKYIFTSLALLICLTANAQKKVPSKEESFMRGEKGNKKTNEQSKFKPFKFSLPSEPKDRVPKTAKQLESERRQKRQKRKNLAHRYLLEGNYSKAEAMYEEFYKEQPQSLTIFKNYIESIKGNEDYEKAIRIIQEDSKITNRIENNIILGVIYEELGEIDQSNTIFDNTILSVQNGPQMYSLAKTFESYGKIEYAIKSYEIIQNKSGDKTSVAYALANLYRQSDQREKMLDAYFTAIPKYKDRPRSLTYVLDKYLENDEVIELQKKIYATLKEDNADPTYNKILIWTYLKLDKFDIAFRQARALDRKENAEGQYVFELANTAFQYKSYPSAIRAYDYLLTEIENFKLKSKAEYNKYFSKFELLKENKNTSEEDKAELTKDFKTYMDSHPILSSSATTYILAAEYEGKYRNKIDTAINILNKVVASRRIHKRISSEAKINLADYLLISGDRWEATLLYSQVDKKMKDAPQGEQARFKNAMLSYYMGDFEWATEQFDVLKRATSKLISNDAIDMSIFINDHLTVDSIDIPLTKFAQSDLLIFQNKYQEAEAVLDEIAESYPQNRLVDDILYRKANMKKDNKQYEEALQLYQKIVALDPKGIKVDNSLFEMAEVYEKHLHEPEKAGAIYKQLFLEHITSTLAVEARKRYRKLRKEFPNL